MKAALLAGAARPAAAQAQAPAGASEPAVAAASAAAGAAGAETASGGAIGESQEDPDSPGMAAVRKAEQHMRRQLAQERAEMRAEFDRERDAYKKQIDVLAEFKAKVEGGKKDRLGLLGALGVTEADYESWAMDLYANSPKGKQDPRFKDRATQLQDERDKSSVIEQLQAKIDKLEQGLSAKEQAQQQQARAESFMARVTGAVTDATPLAKAALAKNPDKTTAQMFGIALELYAASGESDDDRTDPTPAAVLAEYDRRRALELEELGIDPKSALAAKAAPPAPAKPAAAAPAAAPAAPAKPPGSPAAPQRRSRAERIEGLRKHRESLDNR